MTAIKLFCEKETNIVKGFEISGHAGSGEYGHDIVCSSISILAINTQNSIEQLCKDQFEQEVDDKSGYMRFMIKDVPSHDASVLLAAAYIGFYGIAEEYDNFVKIETKEV